MKTEYPFILNFKAVYCAKCVYIYAFDVQY